MKKILPKISAALGFSLLAFASQTMGQYPIQWDGEGSDGQWCNGVNWAGDVLGANLDTHIFTSADAGHPTITVSCDHSFGRIRFSNQGSVSRTIQIGPDETVDRTFSFSGILVEYINHENIYPGVHHVVSGATNAQGARLKIKINRRDNGTGESKNIGAPHPDCPLTISCDISGDAGIVKYGTGPLFLGGENTHWGTNLLAQGSIVMRHPQALGHGGQNLGPVDGGTLVRTFTTLDLGGQSNINEVITLNGNGLGTKLGGALINSSSNTASIAGGVLSTVTVVAGGSGYGSPPTINFSGGGGAGAAAVAIVKNSVVVGATVTSEGSGYTSPPTVTLSGGGGTGAVAVANLASVILATDSTIGGGGMIDLGCVVSGTGALRKKSAGTLMLSAANTYTGNTTISNGVLALGPGGSIASSPVINVQTGAVFNVSTVTGGYVLGAGQTLKGTGTVEGNVTANGTIAPGDSVGTLAFNGNLTLAGNLSIEVNKSLSPSNDGMTVSGTLGNTGSGTVTVTNLGGSALVAGDSFQIFNKPVVNGQALSVSTSGVVWTNKLAVDGSIAVVLVSTPGPATNLAIQVVGPTSFNLSGWGAPNSYYAIYASTNVTLPMTNWWLIGNALSDGSGLIQFTDAQATNGQRFYRFAQ